MNDDLDELEDQLRQFRPAEVSNELRQRVARDLAECSEAEVVRLAGQSRVRSLLTPWRLVATAAAVLFVIATIAGLRLLDRVDGVIADQRQQAPDQAVDEIPQPPDVVPHQFEPSPPPTMLAYRLASADSVDRLDMLLDRHARVLLSPSEGVDRAGLAWP